MEIQKQQINLSEINIFETLKPITYSLKNTIYILYTCLLVSATVSSWRNSLGTSSFIKKRAKYALFFSSLVL